MVNLVTAAVPGAFGTLETLIAGGEAVDPATMRVLTATGPKRLVNGYGPTECTTFSAWYHIAEVAADVTSIPIGGPTRNTKLHVLDSYGNLLPRCMEGELCVAGPGVAMGYVGDDRLTAARFVEVTIAGESVRVYRTGDLVRRRMDGVIEYLGRRDQQVKLRGFRIELTEIETALMSTSSVGTAVVKVCGAGTHRRLVAFVAPPPGGSVADLSDLRAELATAIPTYMIPARFVVLESLPLTQSGKIDRMALIEPQDLDVPVPTELLDETEQLVLSLWAETLEVAGTTLDDDFFDHGGNSLLAVELLSKLADRVGVTLRLSTLFEARTPRELAEVVRTNRTLDPGSSDVPKHLVTMRAGTPDYPTPLWLVHPAGGSLVLYEPMVAHLDPGRRILGVEARGLDGIEPPLSEVHQIADHQLETILAVQPNGPYRIVGYSIGGIAAVEIARRLMARGAEVEFLGAIEAGIPDGDPSADSRRSKYGKLLRNRDLGGIARLVGESIRNRSKDAVEGIANVTGLASAHRLVLEGMVDAFWAYEPTPLDIGATLFLGDDVGDEAVARLRASWSALTTDGVSVRRVTGAHRDDLVLRDPHASVLAAALEDELDACDRRAR